ncbi:DUF2147 domain-containing protein [Nonlabens ponticola]|uniref:DUF2147 domain-containing protein n=1 Tax=Nonlabens ponticola TaxID=2496866 RepID=A0A3S9MYY6_9FLAO|nr:DUF2147 domain-containing protein [Nonlabens ponticola]AZQ44465.1 DUF2147 domain-containing protein [Nonlabens ponticola]
MKYVVAVLLCFAFAKANSQDVTGTWKTIDDNTGNVMSHVEIYRDGDQIKGKVLKVLDPDAPDPALCVYCPGSRKDQPIEGMVIMYGLEKDGDKYEDGTVIDPKNGKSYDCKIWLEDKNTLNVRGYVAFFYRTQQWQRL